MGQAARRTMMTADEYLAWETGQTIKHEFVDGEAFAMAGAEDRHVTTSINLSSALRQHLRGSPCRVYASDMKLHVDRVDAYFYPDLMVTCSAADHASAHTRREPLLVVEVLSPSTAACDRGDKFAAYRQLPALQEYALIDFDTRRSDVYRKGADGLWVLHPFDRGDAVRLASLDFSISADRLFEDVDPPAAAP